MICQNIRHRSSYQGLSTIRMDTEALIMPSVKMKAVSYTHLDNGELTPPKSMDTDDLKLVNAFISNINMQEFSKEKSVIVDLNTLGKEVVDYHVGKDVYKRQPLHNITRAVSVHITIVSTNTSNIPKKPCFTGLLVSAHACAIDPVPRPASLEKMPLDTPFFILIKKLPTAPPVTDAGENAP